MDVFKYILVTIFLLVRHVYSEETNTYCNGVCTCLEDAPRQGEFTMDCKRSRLNVVPFIEKLDEKTTFLDLSGNNITIVEVELSHEKLSHLKLDNNKIKSVKESVFKGLTHLRHLDLSHNFIESLEQKVFYGLEGLLVLNLSNNKINTLSAGDLSIFSTLGALEELILSGNPIKHIEKYHFNRILLLNTLDLSNTGVYDLTSDLFSRLDHLQNLNLAQNDFHDVPINGLRSAVNLKSLKLDENPITKLYKKSFTKLHSLQSLSVSFMVELETIEEKTFAPLKSLVSLEIKNNHKLTHIDQNAFTSLFNKSSRVMLQEVDLQQNQLTSIAPLPCNQMKILNLQRNPWTCDCRMKWVKRCEIPQPYSIDLRCNLPRSLQDRTFVTIAEEDYKCDSMLAEEYSIHENRVMRTTFMVIGASLMVSLSLAIVIMIKWKSMRNWWRNRRKGPGAVYYIRAKSNNAAEM